MPHRDALHRVTHDPMLEGLTAEAGQGVVAALVLALHGDGDPRDAEIWEFYYRLAGLREAWFPAAVDDCVARLIIMVSDARRDGALGAVAQDVARRIEGVEIRRHLYRLCCCVVLADRALSLDESRVLGLVSAAFGITDADAGAMREDERRGFIEDAYRLVF